MINLDKFEASGIYTIEIDASQTLSFPVVSGRLLVGTSRRGPINTVVLLKDTKSARSVYGGRDIFLENKGSFFHKSLDIMLNEGPIYAMNILPIDMKDEVDGYVNKDKSGFTVFNTESADINYDSIAGTTLVLNAPLKNYYNRQKFWFASDDELNKVKNANLSEKVNNNVFSIANLSKKQTTVFVRKADVKGYDITVKEWYSLLGADVQVPSYLNADDFISDYMVEIIVVEGDWTNYTKLAQDPVYYKYFTTTGLKWDQVNNFMADQTVAVITNALGSLIPDFQDTTGNIISIDKMFNNQYPVTEMIAAIDGDKLDTIDPTYDAYDPNDAITQRVDIVGYGVDESVNTIDNGDNILLDVVSYRGPSTNLFKYKAAANQIVFSDSAPGIRQAKVYQDSKLYKAWVDGYILNGHRSVDKSGGSPLNPDRYIKITGPFKEAIPGGFKNYIIVKGYLDAGFITESGLTTWTDVVETMTLDSASYNQAGKRLDSNYMSEFDLNTVFDSFELVSPNVLKLDVTTLLTNEDLLNEVSKFIKVGAYLKAKVTAGRPRMLKILSVAKSTAGSPVKTTWTITTMSPQAAETTGIDIGESGTEAIKVYLGIYNYITSLRGIFLDSFKLRNEILPGSGDWQQKIWDFVYDETNIVAAITQGEPLDIRHMVDSFEGQISSSSKYDLVRLGAIHAKSLVFVNPPSMKQFERSSDPSFIDARTGLIRTDYIVDGGDLSLQPSFSYKLATGVEKGVPIESFAYYPIPYVVVRENAKNKSFIPAPYASNAWIRQNNSGDPFAIPAAKRGIITEPEVVGVEYDFSDDDRALLEKAGYNIIVKRKNIGTMLYSNNTAYQRVNSALNNAHVRNTLITIEKDIELILFNFLFDWNDALVQLRVKTLVQNYLDNVVASNGLASYSVVMDDTNNDDYVLENNAGIIDIFVDFKRGIHKFINRITITRVGGKLSALQSGFGIA